MNNNFVYPNYSDHNMRTVPNRDTISQPLYSDAVLALNRGKMASFYLSFNDSIEWRDSIFKGTIEEAGKDYTLIKDATTGKPILIWNIYIDYIIFEENINS